MSLFTAIGLAVIIKSVVKLGGVIVSFVVLNAFKLCVINLNDHGAQCRKVKCR